MAQRAPVVPTPGPTRTTVFVRYAIFWLLFFGMIFFISLFGVVAEA
jgi:hypothetical protein